MIPLKLQATTTQGADIEPLQGGGWRLRLPAGPAGRYRLAQLDDYRPYARRRFPWAPPLSFSLRARASSASVPGTWGFGLWNDPFSLSLGFGGGMRRLPALPNAAWFFFASPPNYLSLRDDLPAQGALAATFRSPNLPSPLLGLAAPALPLLALPLTARPLRRLGRAFIEQDAAALRLDPTGWHAYSLRWEAGQVVFRVDGETVCETAVAPRGPLGLVLWVDNQYATLPPDGRLRFGTLPNEVEAWVQIKDIKISWDA